jgi:SOS-response transcriptional repressor LexA
MRASILEANPKKVTSPRIHQSLYSWVKQIIPQDKQIPVSPKKVQANRFRIENKSYQLINLEDTTEISIADSPGLIALWVEDDTMDQVGIEKGDYVLLRWQDTAENNSIVAVVIDNIDTHAKLKSFVEEQGKFFLRPLSSNPDHQSNDFSVMNQGFHIKGVVLGVFKPI